jgi:hypothetical protein
MLLYAVASPARVHGDSSKDDSERPFNDPENNVVSLLFFAPSGGIPKFPPVLLGCVQKVSFLTLGNNVMTVNSQKST